MAKKFLILLIFLLPFLQSAQDFSASWEGHFSYFNIIDVAESDTKIYVAAENAVFIYDVNTQDIEEKTTINGLSGNTISTLYYSNLYELLLIGYENGLIEIVLDNDTNILTVVDIQDKVTIPPSSKGINHFNVSNNLVYISTDFGISVFDLERLEFGDTYFIGDQGDQLSVGQTTIFNNYIYAACRNAGIRRGPLDGTDLIDFQNWETIVNGDFLGVESLTNTLYATGSNRIIYEIQGTTAINRFQYLRVPLKLKGVNDNLLVTTDTTVFVYDENFNLISQIGIDENFETEYTSASLYEDSIYIGTTNYGILKTTLSESDGFEEIHPDGPLLNQPFSLKAFSNDLWVTYGDFTPFYNPSPLRSFGVSHLKSEGWTNIPYDSIFSSRNLNTIAVNPFKTDQVFISSFQDGLLEINDDIPTIRYDQTNSGLESLVLPNNPSFISLRLSGLQFDSEGLLWSITSLTQSPLKSYNPSTGQWRKYDFTEIIADPLADNLGFNKIVIAPDGTKFISSFSKGLIGFNENGSNFLLKQISTEEENFPDKSVRSIALDRRNQLWIGTHSGLRVLFNTANFFNEENTRVEEIIIEEDGVAKELLFEQFISDIEVDGANNKWISTFESGLFFLSPDGQRTIFHFTTDNSPLPSNIVNDISLDESNGILYIATQKGLVSFRTGSSSTSEDFSKSHAYPNPVRPGFDIVEEKVKITDLPENVNIKITDIEGNLVAEAQSRTNQRFQGFNLEIDGGIAYWNGKNLANNIVASGVYLIMLSDLNSFETKVVKLMVVR
ncbi:type IX secretion system anionic LPS delivery protein PorZ [Hyunsoonleella pacifica]|uniref:ABC transporter substrate-binding protein n=1 Tax=Hyunsoonleella pacifica TaxID=1080224 RepID=A0A4Q9FPB1_9FLAO|nr:two-component regulator propeller domain-containing protein [Hyunsoonleella pacifica]TBN16539.1 ABC transporter substrate-binding protein [Hyunsoonleella pacifica]GGD18578.1 ABC transporter substrate-binding protein [Hyunsoonleella pacifica]